MILFQLRSVTELDSVSLWNTMLGLIEDYVEFEVPTAVVMKGTIFWDITRCSSLKVIQRFGGTSIDFHWTTWCYIPEDSGRLMASSQSYSIFSV
jgi:hypothetical protein